jgi:PASTA domain
LNIFHVIFGTLLIAGAWRLLRAASTRAALPADWMPYAPRILGGTAVVLALILGSRMGSSGTRYIYNTPNSTVFAAVPVGRSGGEMSVPDMVGASLADTRITLSRLNLNAVVVGGETDPNAQLLTTRMDPAPGTSVERGSVVRIFVAPVSSLIPTSIGTPTTAIVPSASTANVTTALPAGPATSGTVPDASTIATTTVAPATPTTLAQTSAPVPTSTS